MARTALTPIDVDADGLLLPPAGAVAANVDGNSIPFGDEYVLWVGNADVSPKTVSKPVVADIQGLTIPAKQVVVANGTSQLIAGVGHEAFIQPDGTVWVDYSAVTSVTVACLRIVDR
ncbi:MAG: hypothetical protein ACRD0W_19710 [Acidimicrobiales bacterium]